MKDNYSWLDKVLKWGIHDVYEKRQAKQTIISQIEIEKLRAMIDELKRLPRQIHTPEVRNCIPQAAVNGNIADLTEKLKELESMRGGNRE